MKNLTEAEALDMAARAFRHRQYDARNIRGESRPKVKVEEELVSRSLVLVQAALLAALPRVATDPKLKTVHACFVLQLQLIWSGWEETVDGFYAAAASKCRLIAELSDFALVASVDEERAKKILDTDFLKAGHARAYIEAEIIEDRAFAAQWGQAQRELHQELNQFAHVGAGLLTTVMHRGDDVVFVGHDFNETTLIAMAVEYAQLSIFATRAAAEALGCKLADGGAWQAAHLKLLDLWAKSSDEIFRRAGISDRTKTGSATGSVGIEE